MWAALGNFLKNKLKKTAINAAKGDESSQRSLLIIGVSCIGLFLVVIILITIIIFGPVIVTKEFIEKVKNSEVSVTIDKINNVLSLKGWCSDIDGSCEKKIEQQYYEKLGEVYDKNNKNVDTQLITGTIFYNYSLGTNIYEENEDGINERFVNMYCDSIPGWGYEVACDVLIKNNKEKYMELYASKKDRYTLLSSNYEQIKEKCKNDNNSLKDKTMLIPALIPFSISLDVTVSEACEFYIWHAEDIGEYSQIEQDIQYMTYKRAMEDNLIETLANQMLSGGRIDYNKYRDYLIKNYIPTYLKDAYKYSSEKEKKIEMIADEIMSFASMSEEKLYSQYAYNIKQRVNIDLDTSYLNNLYVNVYLPECMSVKNCDDSKIEYTVSLEDYVVGVAYAEAESNYDEALKANMIAIKSVVLQLSTGTRSPVEIDGKYYVSMLNNTKEQTYCNQYDGCEHYTRKTNPKKAPMSDEKQQRYHQLYNDVVNEFIYNIETNAFVGSYRTNDSDCVSANLLGSCMSHKGSEKMAAASNTYTEILAAYYTGDNGILDVTESVVTIGSYSSTNTSIISGGNYTSSAPYYETSFSFFSNVDYNFYETIGMAGSNYGECPWYARGRAAEIINYSNMPDELKQKVIRSLKSTRGNGSAWYTNPSDELFTKTTDLYAAKPGSIVSWSGGSTRCSPACGHVGIIEDVEYDSNGRAVRVLMSEGWNGTRNPENASYQAKWWTMEKLRAYSSKRKYYFNGYVYLLD